MKSIPLVMCLWAGTISLSAGDTLTVNSVNDSGPGSLRDAIQNASAGDTITFDLPSPSTISLTSGELLIDKDLVIFGPGPAELVVTAIEPAPPEDGFRIFEIAADSLDVTIAGITITGALDQFSLSGLDGGGVLNQSDGAVNIINCLVTANNAISGGGISNHGTLQIDQSTISSNSVTPNLTNVFPTVLGGGIHNSGTLTITNSTIANNSADSQMGGPPAAFGAGIYNVGALTLSNCTITGGDMFKGDGGGIYNQGTDVQITNCTISNNVADDGTGGITNAPGVAAIIIANDIIADNIVVGIMPAPDLSGTFTSEGYNLIGDGAGATITSSTGDQIGTDAAPIDPMLGPLQDNGGATQTLALLPGSPAIDKGGPANGLPTDQRGRFRPVDDPTIAPAIDGNNRDIGAFEVQADQSLNISTRAQVLTGENILDGGFIVTGADSKEVLIRGLGPSLGDLGVSGLLMDPTLELHDAHSVLQSNDNWKDSQEAEIEATGIPPTNDAESALIATLDPGEYTVILQGKDGGTGIGLVEIYDLNAAANSTLGNISTRGLVGLDDNVMIGGFILGAGEQVQATVLVRVLGPSLAAQGVMDPLTDPALELHDENGALVVSNEDWKDSQEAEIEATGLAPTDDKEAAIMQTLANGAYTAVVRGSNQTSGVGLVEVYNLH